MTWRLVLFAVLVAGALSLGGGDPTGSAKGGDPGAARVPRGATNGVAPAAPPISQSFIGESVLGQPIEAFTLGEGDTTVLLVGGIHTGEEAVTVMLVESLLWYHAAPDRAPPEGVQLVVVPNLNPDGYLSNTRTNANGVDLNRNWPTADWQPEGRVGDGIVDAGSGPLSEPETRALYDLLIELEPDLVITWHAHAGLVDANDEPLARDLAQRFACDAGYQYVEEWDFYPITGQLIDAAGELGIPAFDVELAGPPEDPFAPNRRALTTVLEALAGGDVAGSSASCVEVEAAGDRPGSPS